MKLNTKELFNKAHQLLVNDDDLTTSEHIFNVLLNNDAESDVLIFYLGCVHHKKKNYGLSALLFKCAIERKKDFFVQAWQNLGVIYKEQGQIEKAKEIFEKILTHHPNDPDALANLASVEFELNELDSSLQHANKAIELMPDHQTAHWNRALCLFRHEKFEQAFKDYDYGERIKARNERNYWLESVTPEWDGSHSKTVVVIGEQGIGDEIMFASMLPDLIKDCYVIFDAHPRLANIFRHSFPGLPIYGTRKDNKLVWPQFHDIDAKILIGSLGKYYRKKVDDFPKTSYLKADPKFVELYRKKLNDMGEKPKIGISWRGGTTVNTKLNRFIPLELWLPILKLDADFISLQYDNRQYTDDSGDQVKELCDQHNVVIHHWQDTLDDYDLTAGLVSNLDLIISVPQSVVHLAGALGTPTWQLCPRKALWQMGAEGQDMPWYCCVKNYWQDETEKWEVVINNVKEELCHLLAKSIVT